MSGVRVQADTSVFGGALHVAVAVSSGCGVTVSWNFKPIVHLRKISLYPAVNALHGHPSLAIFLPREVIDEEEAGPTSLYRVLKEAGRLRRWNQKPRKKGMGFVQPIQAHEHGHVEVSYLNRCGTLYD
jgi:hypothetical protein